MDQPYVKPNAAIALRLHNFITTPQHLTSPPKTPTTLTTFNINGSTISLFELLKLHLINEEHLNYIEMTSGNTALMSLCTTIHFNPTERLEILYWMLENGVDTNIRNVYTQKSCLHILLETIEILNVELLHFIFDLLFKYCVDLNIVDTANMIPLSYLIANTHLKLTPFYILLVDLLFAINPHPYPLVHNPKTLPMAFFAFGNKKRIDIQWPELDIDATISPERIKLPFTFPILPQKDFQSHISMILSLYSKLEDRYFEEIRQTSSNIDWQLYYYFIFKLLPNHQQHLLKENVIENMSHPQFYTFPGVNPFLHSSSLYLSIMPKPIHCIFSILPKVNIGLSHDPYYDSCHDLSTLTPSQDDTDNNSLNNHNPTTTTTSLPSSSPPIPTESIITNPILPPIPMLRFLYAIEPALLSDVTEHITILLQSNPYLTPYHIDLIKFLVLLSTDEHHQWDVKEITQLITMLFTHSYTIPSPLQLTQLPHIFNPIQTYQLSNGLTRPLDFYGGLSCNEDDWVMDGSVRKRTEPYLDLIDFCFSLYEQSFYNNYCPKRNPLNQHGRASSILPQINQFVAVLLFLSGGQHSTLHPLQIKLIHERILYYTSSSNCYNNIPFLLDQFESHGVEQTKAREISRLAKIEAIKLLIPEGTSENGSHPSSSETTNKNACDLSRESNSDLSNDSNSMSETSSSSSDSDSTSSDSDSSSSEDDIPQRPSCALMVARSLVKLECQHKEVLKNLYEHEKLQWDNAQHAKLKVVQEYDLIITPPIKFTPHTLRLLVLTCPLTSVSYSSSQTIDFNTTVFTPERTMLTAIYKPLDGSQSAQYGSSALVYGKFEPQRTLKPFIAESSPSFEKRSSSIQFHYNRGRSSITNSTRLHYPREYYPLIDWFDEPKPKLASQSFPNVFPDPRTQLQPKQSQPTLPSPQTQSSDDNSKDDILEIHLNKLKQRIKTIFDDESELNVHFWSIQSQLIPTLSLTNPRITPEITITTRPLYPFDELYLRYQSNRRLNATTYKDRTFEDHHHDLQEMRGMVRKLEDTYGVVFDDMSDSTSHRDLPISHDNGLENNKPCGNEKVAPPLVMKSTQLPTLYYGFTESQLVQCRLTKQQLAQRQNCNEMYSIPYIAVINERGDCYDDYPKANNENINNNQKVRNFQRNITAFTDNPTTLAQFLFTTSFDIPQTLDLTYHLQFSNWGKHQGSLIQLLLTQSKLADDFNSITDLMNMYAQWYEQSALVRRIWYEYQLPNEQYNKNLEFHYWRQFCAARWDSQQFLTYIEELTISTQQPSSHPRVPGSAQAHLNNIYRIEKIPALLALIQAGFAKVGLNVNSCPIHLELGLPVKYNPPPISFYQLFTSKKSLPWFNRPLWPTLKWLIDYTPFGQSFSSSDYLEIFRANFSSLSDQQTDELWYYLKFHLGLTPSRALQHFQEKAHLPNYHAVKHKYGGFIEDYGISYDIVNDIIEGGKKNCSNLGGKRNEEIAYHNAHRGYARNQYLSSLYSNTNHQHPKPFACDGVRWDMALSKPLIDNNLDHRFSYVFFSPECNHNNDQLNQYLIKKNKLGTMRGPHRNFEGLGDDDTDDDDTDDADNGGNDDDQDGGLTNEDIVLTPFRPEDYIALGLYQTPDTLKLEELYRQQEREFKLDGASPPLASKTHLDVNYYDQTFNDKFLQRSSNLLDEAKCKDMWFSWFEREFGLSAVTSTHSTTRSSPFKPSIKISPLTSHQINITSKSFTQSFLRTISQDRNNELLTSNRYINLLNLFDDLTHFTPFKSISETNDDLDSLHRASMAASGPDGSIQSQLSSSDSPLQFANTKIHFRLFNDILINHTAVRSTYIHNDTILPELTPWGSTIAPTSGNRILGPLLTPILNPQTTQGITQFDPNLPLDAFISYHRDTLDILHHKRCDKIIPKFSARNIDWIPSRSNRWIKAVEPVVLYNHHRLRNEHDGNNVPLLDDIIPDGIEDLLQFDLTELQLANFPEVNDQAIIRDRKTRRELIEEKLIQMDWNLPSLSESKIPPHLFSKLKPPSYYETAISHIGAYPYQSYRDDGFVDNNQDTICSTPKGYQYPYYESFSAYYEVKRFYRSTPTDLFNSHNSWHVDLVDDNLIIAPPSLINIIIKPYESDYTLIANQAKNGEELFIQSILGPIDPLTSTELWNSTAIERFEADIRQSHNDYLSLHGDSGLMIYLQSKVVKVLHHLMSTAPTGLCSSHSIKTGKSSCSCHKINDNGKMKRDVYSTCPQCLVKDQLLYAHPFSTSKKLNPYWQTLILNITMRYLIPLFAHQTNNMLPLLVPSRPESKYNYHYTPYCKNNHLILLSPLPRSDVNFVSCYETKSQTTSSSSELPFCDDASQLNTDITINDNDNEQSQSSQSSQMPFASTLYNSTEPIHQMVSMDEIQAILLSTNIPLSFFLAAPVEMQFDCWDLIGKLYSSPSSTSLESSESSESLLPSCSSPPYNEKTYQHDLNPYELSTAYILSCFRPAESFSLALEHRSTVFTSSPHLVPVPFNNRPLPPTVKCIVREDGSDVTTHMPTDEQTCPTSSSYFEELLEKLKDSVEVLARSLNGFESELFRSSLYSNGNMLDSAVPKRLINRQVSGGDNGPLLSNTLLSLLKQILFQLQSTHRSTTIPSILKTLTSLSHLHGTKPPMISQLFTLSKMVQLSNNLHPKVFGDQLPFNPTSSSIETLLNIYIPSSSPLRFNNDGKSHILVFEGGSYRFMDVINLLPQGHVNGNDCLMDGQTDLCLISYQYGYLPHQIPYQQQFSRTIEQSSTQLYLQTMNALVNDQLVELFGRYKQYQDFHHKTISSDAHTNKIEDELENPYTQQYDLTTFHKILYTQSLYDPLCTHLTSRNFQPNQYLIQFEQFLAIICFQFKINLSLMLNEQRQTDYLAAIKSLFLPSTQKSTGFTICPAFANFLQTFLSMYIFPSFHFRPRELRLSMTPTLIDENRNLDNVDANNKVSIDWHKNHGIVFSPEDQEILIEPLTLSSFIQYHLYELEQSQINQHKGDHGIYQPDHNDIEDGGLLLSPQALFRSSSLKKYSSLSSLSSSSSSSRGYSTPLLSFSLGDSPYFNHIQLEKESMSSPPSLIQPSIGNHSSFHSFQLDINAIHDNKSIEGDKDSSPNDDTDTPRLKALPSNIAALLDQTKKSYYHFFLNAINTPFGQTVFKLHYNHQNPLAEPDNWSQWKYHNLPGRNELAAPTFPPGALADQFFIFTVLFSIIALSTTSLVDSSRQSQLQSELITWLSQFCNLHLSQHSSLFSPSNPKPYSLSSLPPFRQPVKLTFDFESSVANHYQSELLSCGVNEIGLDIAHDEDMDFISTLISTYQKNNRFWLRQLNNLLIRGGIISTREWHSVSGAFLAKRKALYSTFGSSSKSNGSGNIISSLPINPDPINAEKEFKIWTQVDLYRKLQIPTSNQFLTPIDALCCHPVVEISFFFTKLRQYAQSRLGGGVGNNHNGGSRILVITLAQLMDELAKLCEQYHENITFVTQTITKVTAAMVSATNEEATPVSSPNSQTKVELIYNRLTTGSHEQNELQGAMDFINEWRFWLDFVLPQIDLYPNYLFTNPFGHSSARCNRISCSKSCLSCSYYRAVMIASAESSYKAIEKWSDVQLINKWCKDPQNYRTNSICGTTGNLETQLKVEISALHQLISDTGHSNQTTCTYENAQFIVDNLHPTFIGSSLSYPNINPATSTSHPTPSATLCQINTFSLPPLKPLESQQLDPFYIMKSDPDRIMMWYEDDYARPRGASGLRADLSFSPKYYPTHPFVKKPSPFESMSNPNIPTTLSHSFHDNHNPIELTYHLTASAKIPSWLIFFPAFNTGLLWYLFSTTTINVDDIVALLSSSRYLPLYNTPINQNKFDQTILHLAVLQRADQRVLDVLLNVLTSHQSAFTLDYGHHDMTYTVLFTQDHFGWILVDYINYVGVVEYAPEWVHKVKGLYKEYNHYMDLEQNKINPKKLD